MTAAKPTLLVVEDEALLRLDLVDQAQRAGFAVLEAGSAPEALAILEARHDIRVVFTDIRMPGDFDGLHLARMVRDRWPPTVIVICSANEPPPPKELPPNALFVAKPLNGNHLAELLSSIMSELA